MKTQPLRILCLRSGALGDFMVLLPALAALRSSNPGAVIHLATRPSYGELARACGLADEISSIDSAGWAEAFGADGFAPAERMRLASFDCVVNCLHDPDGVVAANLRAAVPGRLLNIPGRLGSTHAARHFMAPLLDAGLVSGRPQTFRLKIKPMPLPAGIGPLPFGPRAVALHPGSGSPVKNWPAGRYAALAAGLEQSREWRPFFIFGEADARVEEEIVRLAPEARRMGNLSLLQLAAVLGKCAAYVGNDSGVTHLAAGLGLKVTALFGPSDPEIWRPCGRSVRVIKARPDFGDLGVERVLKAVMSRA